MSQADIARLLIPAMFALSALGALAMAWWEKRHPSRFEPVDEEGAEGDGVGRRAVEQAARINALHRP
ncbi:hypothetical protein [Streptomyces caniscabiei]|uniref:Secreted protein n=1 Tax=Streptomyces caniscabiei TaxID=2746961 RepID=A0ABU4MYP9_9ACTN|nr:hypothetical protein [Streptomyces caniscabiei]MBE4790316.1 hypothetical protein [Streptomyces caniscabiei]MBE4799455.1 hypothetical protein [Streptomyces caniscabiei]MDX3015173.1 hypothetical protein [Streptomyces caniscabiei]MDX3042616.1 hypothetical protein [Streptomyces caniscabiei]